MSFEDEKESVNIKIEDKNCFVDLGNFYSLEVLKQQLLEHTHVVAKHPLPLALCCKIDRANEMLILTSIADLDEID